ncbi:hypothetical protein [Tamlana sp. I1]|uniref:hypothetical protein n=1 Tax=Tamlana sp. I1 TaxID=2762061 RepID=UPI00188F6ECD|nr:hypothetical protein [Tamlana sp. I1]
MKVIKYFKYKEALLENDSIKTGEIGNEFKRPKIFLLNENDVLTPIDRKKMDIYTKRLIVNSFAKGYFDFNDLDFLSNTYQFNYCESKAYKGYYTANINTTYGQNGNLTLINFKEKEYLIIEFYRDNPDETAQMNDQLGPGFTYIHGIWEQPILTESIREKLEKL